VVHDDAVSRSFDSLVGEASSVDIEGWDFSWLAGRALETRPTWGYQRLLAGKLNAARVALDLQTGGGEVLASAAREKTPAVMATTEGWPPNIERAARLLRPLGVTVLACHEAQPLPFADASFDLVASRHPAVVHWPEIARVLQPGGTYFAQHVGDGANVEISEFFLGPIPPSDRRHPDVERAAAESAGLEIIRCENERLTLEFYDVGAVIYFLRKVVWTVPGFTVADHLERLRELHDLIQRDGAFRSSTSRTLMEAHKPVIR
jgi:SAM-dependent methyltransferase